MTIELIWGTSFTASYKKRIKNNPELKAKFWEAMELFVEDYTEPSLRTHKLTGKLEGHWALSIDADCRVIFKFLQNNKKVFLIDIGSHEEVY
ncbi:MAG: type II toxin-antitoxin system mRNA interferase toxin, RelE/StbE family [Bacteroidota bacterium]|nr:type II toxin-antitoxin system mRNA interferase toxin, RelE/StbE family [Bacteroidota bacterium]